MTKESKILIAILVVMLGWNVYSHWGLEEQIRRTQLAAQTCACPQTNAPQVNGAMIRALTRHSVASHSYAEHLLEGLVRHEGLPIDEARASFNRGMESAGGVPEGWRWLEPWETSSQEAEERAAP